MSSAETNRHRIRLAGPWRYHALWEYRQAEDGSLRVVDASEKGTARMPCDWGESLGAAFRGRVRYQRVFHWPAPLVDEESLWLALDGVDSIADIWLNDALIGQVTRESAFPRRIEISDRVLEQNRLVIEVECRPYPSEPEERRIRGDRVGLPGGLFGEVRLEVASRR